MDMTRPSSAYNQTEDPIKIQHPEEEEHHESGASKMFRKVKAKAKKFKNSLTKHGNENDHDVVEEEDDEDDEQEPEKHTREAESLRHPGETKVPAPEEITPRGTKSVPVFSSDYTEDVEPKTLRDASFGHDDAPSHPVKLSDVSDREESREAHHAPLDAPVSLLSETEDVPVTREFAPGEDESLGGQWKVNIESRDDEKSGLGLGRDLPAARSHEFEWESESGVKKDSPARFGGESGTELGNDFPARSFEVDEKKTEYGFGGKPETGLREDFPAKGHEFDQKIESGIGKDSPVDFAEIPGTGLRENFPAKSFEFDEKIESVIDKDSPMGFGGKPGTEVKEDFPAKSYEFDQKIESGIEKDSPTEFGGNPGIEQREDFPGKTQEFDLKVDQKVQSGIGKDAESGGKPGTEQREDFLGKSYEFDQEIKSEFVEDSTKGSHGYVEESKSELDENIPAKDLPVGTSVQSSPIVIQPKELMEDEDSEDETQEPKPTTYTEMIGSATSFVTGKAVATKNAVTSRLGYSGETTGAGGECESPVVVETPGSVADKLTPVDENVKETGSPVTTKSPFSGEAEETEKGSSARDYLAAKLKPGEEDKALSEISGRFEGSTKFLSYFEPPLSEMIIEKFSPGREKKTTTTKELEKIPSGKIPEETEHGEAVSEEANAGGGGMVGKIKGAYNYWLGGTTEEVKPKSPVSGEDSSSQSLGSTVGTKGFPDSGESGLGETGGVGGAVPVHRGL